MAFLTGAIIFFAKLALTGIVTYAFQRIGQWLFGPDPLTIEGPQVDDLTAQRSEYGRPIPIAWGVKRLHGTVIWNAPEWEHEIEEVGEGDQKIKVHNYFHTFAIIICKGEIDDVLQVFADKKLIFDNQVENTKVVQMEGLDIRFYLGTTTQDPDPTMEEFEGVGEVPAYRGSVLAVIRKFPLTQYGNHVPQFEFVVTTESLRTDSQKFIPGSTNNLGFLVKHPSSEHIIAQCQGSPQPALWYKINTLTEQIDLEFDGEDDDISYLWDDFDIDRWGRIYCNQWSGSGSNFHLYRMSADQFQFIDVSTQEVRVPNEFVVSQNPDWPYVFSREAGTLGDEIHIWPRVPGIIDPLTIGEPPELTGSWTSFAVNDDPTDGSEPYVAALFYASPNTTWFYKIAANGRLYDPYEIAGGGNYDNITIDRESGQTIVASSALGKVRFYGLRPHISLLLGEITLGHTRGGARDSFHQGVRNNYLWIPVFANDLHKINVLTREIEVSYEFTGMSYSVTGSAGIHDPVSNSWFCSALQDASGNKLMKIRLDRITPQTVPLADVVEDICALVGLTAAQIDTTDLDYEVVRGYALSGRMTARSALEGLARAFFFDCIESEGKIKFKIRGGASVVTIPEEHLGAHIDGEEPPEPLLITREQEIADIPRRVEVVYIDAATHYEKGHQYAGQEVTASQHRIVVQLALSLTADEARQIAEKHLSRAWVGRHRLHFPLPPDYSNLEPADVVTIEKGTASHTVRIEEGSNEDGVLKLVGRTEDASTYQSNALGAELPTEPPDIEWPGHTRLWVIDTNPWTPLQNSPTVVVAVHGSADGWHGAMVRRSSALYGLKNWGIFTNTAVVGRTTSVLADVNRTGLWDDANTVVVKLTDPDATLDTYTKAEVLAGEAHPALIGDEIVFWTDADQDSDGFWTLSGLLRGRRGTEWATGTHVNGDLFVVLDSSLVDFGSIPIAEQSVESEFSAVSLGTVGTESSYYTMTPEFRSLKPWGPCRPTGTRDGSNDLTIGWTRRARISGNAWTSAVGQTVPLDEGSESYEIDILDPASPAIVKRTLTSTSTSVIYTATLQTADGYTPGDPVTCVIYQMSEEVGRGYGSEVTV
jgi:hypothetical protein